VSTSSLKPSGTWRDPAVAESFRELWERAGRRIDAPLLAELEQLPLGSSVNASEKLRWFAIWLEYELLPEWPLLRELYRAARARDGADARVPRSWATAAIHSHDIVPAAARRDLLTEAARVAGEAIALDPGDADLYYALGLALYADEERVVDDAEHAFRRATELDPEHAPARLYLGHCLEDRGRWSEALEQFRGVDEARLGAAFDGAQPWRIGRLREAMATCLLELGRMAEAEHAVELFLDYAERAAPDDLESPEHLAARAGLLPDRLAERVLTISRRSP
jgi:tetratricopeptide (TPR) repeat protein